MNHQEKAVLVARQVRIMDERGNVRGLLGINSSGEPALGFYDDAGLCRTSISLSARSVPVIELNNADGNPAINMCVYPGGCAAIHILDNAGKKRVSIGVADDGSSNAVFGDEAGTMRGGIVCSELMTALQLSDSKPMHRIAVGVKGGDEPGVVFFDKKGRPAKVISGE